MIEMHITHYIIHIWTATDRCYLCLVNELPSDGDYVRVEVLSAVISFSRIDNSYINTHQSHVEWSLLTSFTLL